MSEDPARVNCREFQFTHGYMPLHDGSTCGPVEDGGYGDECACGCTAYDEFCDLALISGPDVILTGEAKPEVDRSDRETYVFTVLAVFVIFGILTGAWWLILAMVSHAFGLSYGR